MTTEEKLEAALECLRYITNSYDEDIPTWVTAKIDKTLKEIDS